MKLSYKHQSEYTGSKTKQLQLPLDNDTNAEVNIIQYPNAEQRLEIIQKMSGLILMLHDSEDEDIKALSEDNLKALETAMFIVAIVMVLTDIEFPTAIKEIIEFYTWLITTNKLEPILQTIPSETLEDMQLLTNILIEEGLKNEQESSENQ